MRIEGTEFEFSEVDLIAFEYYFQGEHYEDYAKRIWNNCNLYKKNNGLDEQGNKLSDFYQVDPFEHWNYILKDVRAYLAKGLYGIDTPKELLCGDCMPDHLCDNFVKECQSHACYCTKAQADEKRRLFREKIEKDLQNGILKKIGTLKKAGMNDEVIKILVPGSENFLPKA